MTSPALPQKVFTEGEKAFLMASVTIKRWYALEKQQDRQSACQRLIPPPCHRYQLFLQQSLSQATRLPSFKYRGTLSNMLFNVISRFILHFYCKLNSRRSSSILETIWRAEVQQTINFEVRGKEILISRWFQIWMKVTWNQDNTEGTPIDATSLKGDSIPPGYKSWIFLVSYFSTSCQTFCNHNEESQYELWSLIC